jgi:photosystem II stability/assembly factor-like uncharacterized protein
MVIKSFKKGLFFSFLLFTFLGFFIYQCSSIKDFKGQKLEPGEFLFLQRSYPSGILPEGNNEEVADWKEKKSLTSHQENGNPVPWQLVGPENIGGRITDIEIPSNNPSTYYIGAATGGVFRTTNAGISWQPIFDKQNTLSIGDMDISKTNNKRILVGTGEPNGGGGSTNIDGTGVYLSDDAGDSWQSKGLTNVGSISKVIIDPKNADNMYVGAMGSLYAQSNNRGVYKSTNGGNTWTNVLFVSDKTGVIDMAINPINPNILYSATWERTRTPITRVYGGATSNIYKSIDAGLTWTLLTNVLPNTTDKGRISIDISNSNPDIVIATYTNATGSTLEIKKTINAGLSWNTLPSSAVTPTPYNWWFGGVFIHPRNSDNVYLSEFNTHYSTNGGNVWSTISNIHVDQHVVAFNSNNEILIGNDGGLYRSTNGTTFSKINNLPITQAYRMTLNPQNPNHVYAGFQDNGTWRTLTGGLKDWEEVYGGDGMQPNVNPQNTNILFAQYQYGTFFRSIDDGVTFDNSESGLSTTEPRNWDTPYVFDPANPNIMYFGTSNLYKSVDNGINWTSISNNLSKGVYTGTQRYGTISSIDVSPLNSKIIFVGTDDGNVWKTIDGGVNFSKISNQLPNKWVTKVKASPTNANQVYVTYSGYRYNLFDSNLYVSNDLGNTWKDLSADLPNTPLSDIEITANNTLYVASDLGVLVSYNLGVKWALLGSNMPSVVVTDLVLHNPTNFLYAATFGRGVFKIDLTQVNLMLSSSEIAISNIKVYPNPASNYLYIDLVFDKMQDFYAEIFDMNGKVVQKYQLKNNAEGKHTIKMHIENLHKGVYVLKIKGEAGGRKVVLD